MTSSIQSFYNTRNNSMKGLNRNITTELFENDKTYSLRQKMTSKEVAQQLRKSERNARKENRRNIVENRVLTSRISSSRISSSRISSSLMKRLRTTVDYYESDQEDDATDGDYGETVIDTDTIDDDTNSDSDYDPEEDQE
jgi:hypothetical protein